MTSLHFCKLVQIFNLRGFFCLFVVVVFFVVVVGFLLCWFFLRIVHRMWKEII